MARALGWTTTRVRSGRCLRIRRSARGGTAHARTAPSGTRRGSAELGCVGAVDVPVLMQRRGCLQFFDLVDMPMIVHRQVRSLMRSLCFLPGGLARFVPCSIGANHCRLRHIGWERCGHGLTSRPRESASVPFLDELLCLFRYPSKSGRALLNGTFPLRYCAARLLVVLQLGGYRVWFC